MAGLGSTPGIIVGVGVGAAAAAALEPAIEIPRQEAWERNQNRILVPSTLARLVAQGGITLDHAHASARRDGYSDDKLDALTYLEQTVPGLGQATDLWRKGLLASDLFLHVLTKSGLDTRYVAPIVANKTAEVLGIGDVAYGVVRGILPAPAWVPVAPPTRGDKVPRFPQVDIDPLLLAEKLGYDEDMLKLAVGRSGLSMAPVMAANAAFRGIIGPNDYLLAIAEGDLRTEWAESVLEVSRQILTAHDYAELQLRGFLSRDQRLAHTGKHGMSAADSDLLYDVLGRSVNVHAITTGLARGGVFDGPTGQIPAEYLQALQRGNLRPEYYNLAYANRYSYPSGFQIRAEAQKGDLTAAQTEEILLEIGWAPKWATFFADKWTGGTTAAADPFVGKAQTQLWGTTHRSYVGEMIDGQTAATALAAVGVDSAAVPQVLTLWSAERALIRKQLTPANIRKALNESVNNPATGQPWTVQDATSALLERGYDLADAQVFLSL